MAQLVIKALSVFTQLLYRRTVTILIILFFAGVLGALWNMSQLSTTLIQSQALQNATLYAQALQEARTLYSSDVVNRVKGHNIVATNDYKNKLGTIPLPATYLIELGQRLSSENAGISVRLYSAYPFPWRTAQGGARDTFEQEALDFLVKNPNSKFTKFEQFGGRLSLRYAQADIMKSSCVNCHNTHPDSPKKDWKVGDVRGVLEVTQPLDAFSIKTAQGLRGTSLTLLGISVLGLTGLILVIIRVRQTSRELEKRVIERTAALQRANQELEVEQQKAERLLLNILPEKIAQKLKEEHENIAEGFANVTILFADLVNFTQLSNRVTPQELVNLLNQIFSEFDSLTEKYGLEKIKTIGDAYMVAGGLPVPRHDHAEAIADMSLEMLEVVKQIIPKHKEETTDDIREKGERGQKNGRSIQIRNN